MARPKGPLAATLREHKVSTTKTRGEFTEICYQCGATWDGGKVTCDQCGATWADLELSCDQCGATWPVAPKGDRLPPLYWQCPNGCNVAPAQPEPEPEPAAVFTDLGQLPALLTPAEAASLLRLAESTVKDLARAGDLPGAFKLGKLWRVERDALLAYIGGLQGKS